MRPSSVPRSLVRQLRPLLRGPMSDAPATLEALSHDFGGLCSKRPALVVRPASTEDVVHVVRAAREHDVAVGVRAGGHSLSGQSLVQDGILLDMRALQRVHAINAEDEWFDVDPGVVWHDLVQRTVPLGLLPPVLTGTLRTTVGGTHSIGGLGHASLRHGSQIDHCLAFEIVTGTGEVYQCSEREHPELFQHALGSLGLFGVITRIRGRLRRVPAYVRQHTLYYASRAALLRDLQLLASTSVAAGAGAYGTRWRGKWLYTLDLTTECAAHERAGCDTVLEGLSPGRIAATVTRPVREQVLRYELVDAGEPRNHVPAGGNPWVDSLLPVDAVAPFFSAALARLPDELRDHTTLLAWPLDGTRLARPMLRRPPGRALALASLFPTLPPELVAHGQRVMCDIADIADALGGMRYVYGWMPQDLSHWSSHYGALWPTICALKARHDPEALLARDRFATAPTAPIATTFDARVPVTAGNGR